MDESTQTNQDIVVIKKNDIETESSKTLVEEPESGTLDGGYAWVIVLASFMINAISMGVPYSFGIYNAAYAQSAEFGANSKLAIAFIGSLGSSGLPLFGTPAGSLIDMYGHRFVLLVGAVGYAVSLILASLATEYWHLLLSHGLMFGISCSLSYFPAITILPHWFMKKRGLATGIAVAGSGLGGLALSPLSQLMIASLGWRWSLRITGIVGGILLIGFALFIRPRIKTIGKPKPTPIDWYFIRCPKFIGMITAGIVSGFGYYIPFFFIPIFAKYYGLSADQGALLVGVMNGASAIGRVLLGEMADLVGSCNSLVVCNFISAFSILLIWPFATKFAGMLGFVVIFGLGVGGALSLTPPVIVQLFGMDHIGTITGLIYSAGFPGNLAGAPLAAVLLQKFTSILDDGTKNIDFLPAILFSGFTMLAGAFSYMFVRFHQAKYQWLKRL